MSTPGKPHLRPIRMAPAALLILLSSLLHACSSEPPDLQIDFTIESLTEQVLVDLDPTDNQPAARIRDLDRHTEGNPNKTEVLEGTTLTTDQLGEGLLEGASESDTCRVYIYRDTQLAKRACPRADYEGGSYMCIEEGSASFQNCSNHLVMTPSGEVEFQGTWLLASYLPAEQVSVFTITEGRARVRPVVDGGSGELGEPVVIHAGQFLYTAPDEALSPIEGLAPRTPHPQERLPDLLQRYDLGRWLDQATTRADEANAPFLDTDTLASQPDLVVRVELGRNPLNFANLYGNGELIYIPLRITASNRGGETAGPFKISVVGSASDGEFLRPFFPYDGEGDFYIFFNEILPPGGEALFTGAIGFSTNVDGEANIYAEIDSCTGEEFPPEGCRVQESDEANNVSDSLVVDLDAFSVPAPVTTVNPEITTAPPPEPPQDASGPSGKIVYVCQVDPINERNQLCLVNADGSGSRRLTGDLKIDYNFPSFAPGGKSIVYVSNRSGKFEIYEMDLSTGEETQRTSSGIDLAAPDISPNGRLVVYTQMANTNSVWVMNRDGSKPYQVFGLPDGFGWDPVWSPDGSRILFASGTVDSARLYSIPAGGGPRVLVTDLPELRGRSDWSPDGTTITTYAGPAWLREIYLMNPDGSNVRQITKGGNNTAPAFSPDGMWITFTSYRDHYRDVDGCEIYIMRLDGTDIRRLTDNNYCDWQPRWGP